MLEYLLSYFHSTHFSTKYYLHIIQKETEFVGHKCTAKEQKRYKLSLSYIWNKTIRCMQELQLIANQSPVKNKGLKAAVTVKKITKTLDQK